MKVLVVGAGTLGGQAALELARLGHEVTVVDRDALVGSELPPPIRVVHGEGCDVDTLEMAGALKADLLLALTGADEDNLVTSLLAKRRFSVPQVAARVNEPRHAWLFGSGWGVDVTLSPTSILISLIEAETHAADTVDLVSLGAGFEVLDTRMTPASAGVGRCLEEVVLPAGSLSAAVVRSGHALRADPGLRLKVGDEVLVVTPVGTVPAVQAAFQGPRRD